MINNNYASGHGNNLRDVMNASSSTSIFVGYVEAVRGCGCFLNHGLALFGGCKDFDLAVKIGAASRHINITLI
jgi:hypothetical protein